MNIEIVRFDTNEATIANIRGRIARMAREYMPLSVKGLNDAEGLKQVHAARIDTKNLRVTITKGGKELREDANAFIKKELTVEKEILSLIAPIEEHLIEEEGKVEAEKERIKREAEEKEAARIKDRVDRLEAMGMVFSQGVYVLPFDTERTQTATPEAVKTVAYDVFEAFVQGVIDLVAKEKERIENEKAARRAEEERLAKIRAEQEAKEREFAEAHRKLREESERIEAEKKRIEAEKQRLIEEDAAKKAAEDRAKELEKAKAEAAEKAKIEAEERAKRDAEQKERDRIEAEEEAKHQEELKPDKEKLLSFADTIKNIPIPSVKHKNAKASAEAARVGLLMVAKNLSESVNRMKAR